MIKKLNSKAMQYNFKEYITVTTCMQNNDECECLPENRAKFGRI